MYHRKLTATVFFIDHTNPLYFIVTNYIYVGKSKHNLVQSHAGSGVVRIDPLLFLAGCRTRRLNQALSVLSLSLGFF